MVRYLAYEVVMKLNFFPVKRNLSTYYSPQTIVDRHPFDYNRHCTIKFVVFVQENNDNNPKNSNVLRKIYGIYLRSLDKIQVRHKIFDIHIHRVITRHKIIQISITKSIIKHIEEMTARCKFILMKFNNRAGVIYDNYWIVGVEYETKNKD